MTGSAQQATRRRAPLAALGVALALAIAASVTLADEIGFGPGATDPSSPPPAADGERGGREPRPGFPVAVVKHRLLLRSAPRGRRLARIGTRTEFGSPRVLSVVARRGEWLGAPLPEMGNGRLGWIPARRAALGHVRASLRVDLSRRRLALVRGRRVILRMPVAVGRPGTPTPTGRFAVTDLLKVTDPGSPYGCCVLALSARQPKLVAGWPGGDRLAIHATGRPETVGQPASLGCLRGRTADVRRLIRLVPLGTPVFIRA